MRLIDADALEEEIKEKMENGFPANEYLSLYAISCIAHAPTVDVLEQIRDEIRQTVDEEQKHDGKWAIGLRYALKIIDTYMKGE